MIEEKHVCCSQRVTDLEKALRSLANEASGFLALSDVQRHGITNSRILRLRIEEARDQLLKPMAPPAAGGPHDS